MPVPDLTLSRPVRCFFAAAGLVLSLCGCNRSDLSGNPMLATPADQRVPQIVWSGCVGGLEGANSVGLDEARAAAADRDGNIFVTGRTQGGMPVLNAAFPNFIGPLPYHDAFLMKITRDGHLLWSTYLGGDSRDSGFGVATDTDGNCYVVGDTASHTFPSGAGGNLQAPQAGWNGYPFISRFSPDGRLLWSRVVHTCGYAAAVAVDDQDLVYVLGRIDESACAPVETPPHGRAWRGQLDCTLTCYARNGDLLWQTCLGGSDMDFPRTMAALPGGGVCVGGETRSADFPVTGTASAAGGRFAGGKEDGFISRFRSDGLLLWSRYVGGSSSDDVLSLAVDESEHVYVTGGTESRDFPVRDGLDMSYNGNRDGYLVKLSPNGDALWSSFLGGRRFDDGRGAAITEDGLVAVAVLTSSPDFPVPPWCPGPLKSGLDNMAVSLFTLSGRLAGTFATPGGRNIVPAGITAVAGTRFAVVGATEAVDFPTSGPFGKSAGGGIQDACVTCFHLWRAQAPAKLKLE